jgi:hypothetical protein
VRRAAKPLHDGTALRADVASAALGIALVRTSHDAYDLARDLTCDLAMNRDFDHDLARDLGQWSHSSARWARSRAGDCRASRCFGS